MHRPDQVDAFEYAIIGLREKGVSIRKIAKELGTGHNVIFGKVFRLRKKGMIKDPSPTGEALRLQDHERPQDAQEILARANRWAVTKKDRRAAFRAAWSHFKSVAGDQRPSEPASVSQYVLDAGGVSPSGDTDGIPLRLLRKTGQGLDVLAVNAQAEGYQTNGDAETLRSMIVDETFGQRHYSLRDADIVQAIEDFTQEEQEVPF